ncbi:MAG: hypothetical protein RL368_2247 [Pseudomonadota bacterium]|jgi:hypothetical protein
MSFPNYLRWIDAICMRLEQEQVTLTAHEIEIIFKPLFEKQIPAEQAIVQQWQQINQYRLTKF